MVPATYANYFLACAGAGGALIGLLFVAVSINPARTFGKSARRERQAVATNAFTAIFNSFFVSTIALLPGGGFGGAALVFAGLGIVNTLGVAYRLLTYQFRRYRGSPDLALHIARGMFVVVGSLVLFGFQAFTAWDLVRHPATDGDVFVLAILVLAAYGLGLARAWELLGAPHTGITGWLNPLADLGEPADAAAVVVAPPAEPEQPGAPPPAAQDVHGRHQSQRSAPAAQQASRPRGQR